MLMKPALVFPYHDPQGTFLPHLQAILPDLKGCFEHAYVCPPGSTLRNADVMQWLRSDPFFSLFPFKSDLPIGTHFAHLYQQAARTAPPGQILHLCFLDRLAFALETDHHDAFLADVEALSAADLPLIFQRSPKAWSTHPENYVRLEGFVTRIGENLFHKTLDYCWCHLALSAGELGRLMQEVTQPGWSLVAEMILHLQHHIHTRDVDWLAWEDPFILGRQPGELKQERESSLAETEKRLSYVLPMVDLLTKFAIDGKS
jgi:hypothetical protein